jgi:starch synthase (maltosyl-transferring)
MAFVLMEWRGTEAAIAFSGVESKATPSNPSASRKIYYMDSRLGGPIGEWRPHLERAGALGFDHLCIPPVFSPGTTGNIFLAADAERAAPCLEKSGSADQAVAAIGDLCHERGLTLLIDIVLDRVAAGSPLSRILPTREARSGGTIIDPRAEPDAVHAAYLRAEDGDVEVLTRFWVDRLQRLHAGGVGGFRLLGFDRLPVRMLADIRREIPSAVLLAWTPGIARDRLSGLAQIGLDGVFASTPWWDGKASWYVEEHEALRRIAPVISPVEAPFGERAAERGVAQSQRRLTIAAATGDGLLVPMGFEFGAQQRLDPRFSGAMDMPNAAHNDMGGLASEIVKANLLVDRLAAQGHGLKAITGPGACVSILRRGLRTVIAIAADRVDVVTDEPEAAITGPARSSNTALRNATRAPRIVIDNITPRVEGGSFAVKRIVGQTVTIEADVFMDGHDVLAVELQWRPLDDPAWRRQLMTHISNDRWQASITPNRIGRWLFTVEACLDELATVRRALQIKKGAGVDFSVEAAEEKTLEASGAHRRFTTRREPALLLDVERQEAGFASWYELFPRSITDDPKRHGTFAGVIDALPRIRDMGFDVLYFPPIHPIGQTNRKGRNNTLTPSAEDVGSAYAIGSSDGGHDALHAQLGTFDDFRRLLAAALDNGLELAIDFAIQCSPDHPWLKEHPGWFRHRPDGTIKYAENPPKKYEDIVNVDFYADGAIPDLWTALRDIVLFWVNEGVRIFRVDNPHTKPLPFWHWLIADVRGRHPDTMFLSEAFTRPKMMYRLAKVGFSQSYSYFTWRNTKQELTAYLTELTTTEVAEFFRPNFFVNTPDINPLYLQSSGRAGFVIRAVLAATLSGLWGVYSGFEICEAAALPNREEYLDSEKYEIRVRDFNAPGNIVGEVTALNRIRKAHPALQSHHGVAFYSSSNDQVIAYGKTAPGHDDMIFTLVTLDPHHPQETSYEVPLWHWGLPDHGALEVEDLMNGQRFTLNGKRQWLRLDPGAQPFMLWRLWKAA